MSRLQRHSSRERSYLQSNSRRPEVRACEPDGTDRSGTGEAATPQERLVCQPRAPEATVHEGQVKVTGLSAPDGGLPSRERLGMESGSPLSLRLRKKLRALAATDPSPVVRLYLASALQRLPAVQRLPVAQALV